MRKARFSTPRTDSEFVKRLLADRDPVVAYTLFDAAGHCESRDEIGPQALEQYIRLHNEYDAVLQDWVAGCLRTSALPSIQELNYQHGYNSTAALDWSILKKHLGKNEKSGIQTPLPSVNKHLGTGIKEITVVSGGEMSGKTTLCLQTLINAQLSDPRLGSLIFSLDQSKTRTLQRLWRIATGLPISTVSPEIGEDSIDQDRWQKAEAEFLKNTLSRMRIVERSNLTDTQAFTWREIATKHEELARDADVDRVVVLIDMIQSMSDIHTSGTQNDADEYCLGMIQEYIAWSRTRDCPEGATVLLTSEVRKDRREWRNDNLKGSARLRSTPSNILHLEPLPGSPQKGAVVGRILHIGKSRDGAAGEAIELDFHHIDGRFRERTVSSPRRTTASSFTRRPRNQKRRN